MVSFGIEWDTHALIYLPKNNLPRGVLEKTSAIFQTNPNGTIISPGWTISLEGWYPHGRPESLGDCMFSMEVQMGVFDGNNIRSFQRSCGNFRETWNKMINDKKITIAGVEYDVLSYTADAANYTGNGNKFLDCARKKVGSHLKQDGKEWAYVDSLERVNGKMQFTTGIALENIINLFARVTRLVNLSKEIGTWDTDNIARKLYLNIVVDAYEYTRFQVSQLPFDGDLIACIMLCNYYLLSFRHESTGYIKARFLFKMRTNMASIYQHLSDANKIIFIVWKNWVITAPPDQKGFENTFLKNNIQVSDWLNGIINPTMIGYTIVPRNGGTMKAPSLGIYSVSSELLNDPRFTFTQINVDTAHIFNPDTRAAGTPPSITISEGVLDYDSGSMFSFDYGEWTMSGNNVYFEIRGPEAILTLLDTETLANKGGRQVSRTNIYKRGSLKIDELCEEVIRIVAFMRQISGPSIFVPWNSNDSLPTFPVS